MYNRLNADGKKELGKLLFITHLLHLTILTGANESSCMFYLKKHQYHGTVQKEDYLFTGYTFKSIY